MMTGIDIQKLADSMRQERSRNNRLDWFRIWNQAGLRSSLRLFQKNTKSKFYFIFLRWKKKKYEYHQRHWQYSRDGDPHSIGGITPF